jgi:hypothetical protein
MAKLKKIQMRQYPAGHFYVGHEIRLEWDNGWMQAVSLDSFMPEDIKTGLIRLIRDISASQLNKDL